MFKGEAPLFVCLCATLKVCLAQLDANRPQMWDCDGAEQRLRAVEEEGESKRGEEEPSEVQAACSEPVESTTFAPPPRREVPAAALTRRAEKNTDTPSDITHRSAFDSHCQSETAVNHEASRCRQNV